MISYIVIVLPDTLERREVDGLVKVLEDIGLTCQGPVWMPLTQENIEQLFILTDVLKVWKLRYPTTEYTKKIEEFFMHADMGNMLMIRCFNEKIQIPVHELAKKMRELYKKYNVPNGSVIIVEDKESIDGAFRIVYDSPLEFGRR